MWGHTPRDVVSAVRARFAHFQNGRACSANSIADREHRSRHATPDMPSLGATRCRFESHAEPLLSLRRHAEVPTVPVRDLASREVSPGGGATTRSPRGSVTADVIVSLRHDANGTAVATLLARAANVGLETVASTRIPKTASARVLYTPQGPAIPISPLLEPAAVARGDFTGPVQLHNIVRRILARRCTIAVP